MQRLKRKLQENQNYMPGINEWALQKVAMRENRPLQNSMDGTRVIRAIELCSDQYLIKEFPADVRLYPKESDLPVFEDAEQTIKYICKVRTNSKYAAEAYSIDFVDTTGKLTDLLIGSIPESKTGVTNAHIFALMMMIEKQSKPHNIPLIGHCTDSAGNSLQGLQHPVIIKY